MTSTTSVIPDLDQILEDVLSSFAEHIAPGPGSASEDDVDSWLESWVDITGPWQGKVALAVPATSAPEFAAAMLGTSSSQVTVEDAADALCELVNMIGGQVKGTLATGCRLSLPLVRTTRQSDETPAAQALAAAGVSTFDWRGHALRISIRGTEVEPVVP
jgi:CheY-specific phosphatase CheX